MALNDDCLLHVLRRCSAQDVCNVSRTSKRNNFLVNWHINILPQIHKSLLVKFRIQHMNMRVRCQPSESQNLDDFGSFIDNWRTGLSLDYFLEHWRYAVVDEIVIHFDAELHDGALVKKFFKDLETLNVEKITIFHNRDSLVLVSGPGPKELQRFLKSVEGGIFQSSFEGRQIEIADRQCLFDCLLHSDNFVMILGYESATVFSSFIEQLLKEASVRKTSPSSFYITNEIGYDMASSFAEELAERIRRFAAVSRVRSGRYCWHHYNVLLTNSKTVVTIRYADFIKRIEVSHAQHTLTMERMSKMVSSFFEQPRSTGSWED